MKLRHKKPINSYIGQTNHDSSSIQDEYFEKCHNFTRRQKMAKLRTVTEQTKKYAQTLFDFVSVLNQSKFVDILDYRRHQEKKIRSIPPTGTPNKNSSVVEDSSNNKNIYNENLNGKTEVVFKQYQNIRKQEQNSYRLPPATKKIKKNKPVLEEVSKRRQERYIPVKKTIKEEPVPSPSLNKNIIDLTEHDNEKKQTQLHVKVCNVQNRQKYPDNMFLNHQNPNPMNLLQYQLFMMNYQNPEFMKSPQGIQYFNQLTNMYNIMSYNMQNLQNQQGMSGQYIPFTKLPFLNQEGIDNYLTTQQKAQMQNPYHPPPSPTQHQNIKKEATQKTKQKKQLQKMVKIENQSKQPILKVECKVKESQVMQNQDEKTPNFNKRASNHVSIAYNIHFLNLKKKGILNNDLSGLNKDTTLNIIDPTYEARKIRERKNSEGEQTVHQLL